jgi:hypothetical protein
MPPMPNQRLIDVNLTSRFSPTVKPAAQKEQCPVNDPEELRELAGWYREFAERAGNPAIWDGRLRTAEDLEAQARRIECSAPQRIDASGAR